MGKPSSPTETLEAVSLLALLLVSLVPDVSLANRIDIENILELHQSRGKVTVLHRHAPALVGHLAS